MHRWCVTVWSVEHSHTHRSGYGRPRNTDARQDRRIVRATIPARRAPREGIRAHDAPSVSPRTIGIRLLAAGHRLRVPLARLPLTPRHLQARLLSCRERVDRRVEWRSVVFRDESRFRLYATDGRARARRRPGEQHLLQCIRTRHKDPTSGFMMWGQSVTPRVHIWCFCRVK